MQIRKLSEAYHTY